MTGMRSNGGYVLNGAKTFITNAPEASHDGRNGDTGSGRLGLGA